jgi:acetyl/propionyl-CoA carboxylase alpha subunit
MVMEDKHQVVIEGGYAIDISSEDLCNLDVVALPGNQFHVLHDGKSYLVEVVSEEGVLKKYTLRINGELIRTSYRDQLDLLMDKLGFEKQSSFLDNRLVSPMPGLVLDVMVEVGQTVEAGEKLLILEAMKMENLIKAPASGIVQSIVIKKGQSLEKGQLLMEFEFL